MAEKRVQRKLAAILAADVVGYARLMREDEEATLRTLTEYREVIAGLIDRHNGRVFNTGGDSLLAEFGSVVEAVRCAISFQEEIAICNTELPDDRKLCFRIGINVGDVMVKDDDLFGDGVNIAARLEGLAEPAGICISGSVFEQIKHKLSLGFEDLGPQQVKNISEPVSAFRIVPGSVTVAAGAGVATRPSSAGRWQALAFVVVAVLIIGAGVAVLWQTFLRPPQEPQKAGSGTGTVLPIPNQPSDMIPNNGTGRAASSIPNRPEGPRQADAESMKEVKTIEVGRSPVNAIFDADGKYAYVANWGSHTVSVIEVAGWRVVKTIKVGTNPFGIYLFDPGKGKMAGNR